MLDIFSAANLKHIAVVPVSGQASELVVTRDNYADAVAEIKSWNGYTETPLHTLRDLSNTLGIGGVFYKDEAPRFGLGSFKALGGSYAGLRVIQRELRKQLGKDISAHDIRKGTYADDVAEITLVSATDGNHGKSLSWGAQRFGAPCRIYIHREVSEIRAQAMRDFGATVTRVDGDYDASVEEARNDANENGWFVVSDTSWEGYTQPPIDVMAGYGVMTRETFEQMRVAPTHVFIQCGCGGLAAGVSASFRQLWGDAAPRVVIVEPELAPCLFESAKAGEKTDVEVHEETLMAGLSVGEPSGIAWQILSAEASDYVTIPESLIAPAMRLLAQPLGDDPKIVAGESAIAGLAALIAGTQQSSLRDALGLTTKSRVLLIGSEGATDPAIYASLVNS
ncbi:diaminopropionate ammonia-lyase [Anderseniella sp. Alg231-50]|uniref:diaminopropionate ammonia-lyase n=1 Tax=Anderseniella sp. Alg231-50 TaxID=1922226 RepID=UPI000D55A23F